MAQRCESLGIEEDEMVRPAHLYPLPVPALGSRQNHCVPTSLISCAMRHSTVLSCPACQVERIRGAVPLGRWGEADDIANAVLFLNSPQAAWITGETLRVRAHQLCLASPLPAHTRTQPSLCDRIIP